MLDIKILDITKRVLLYVLDSNSLIFDFIIALDLIPIFRLALDHELVLSQIQVIPPAVSINSNVIWNDYFIYRMNCLQIR